MTTSTLALREYQNEAIEAVLEKAATVRRQLIVMSTGLGKTATAVNLAQYHLQCAITNRRVLWLTHRDELVQQTLRAIATWAPDIEPGVVKAELNQTLADFVVASVQTLAVENRRNTLVGDQVVAGQFGLVISDEHHHSPSPTWAAALDALGCGEVGGPLMVGLTATPNRADGVGLKATTDEIVFERDTVWAIANGYLVPPKGITIDVDLSTVKSSGGDYQSGSLGDVLELEGAHAAIAAVVEQHAKDRKTIIFTPTVKFAGLVAAELVYAGFSAEMVSGETPLPDRQAIYQRLRKGETQIVVNCMVLTEGFDEPSVDCIVVARPTKSNTLFIQMVGRGLRTYPGKEDCMVIALAGTERHKLATLASLAGRTYEQAMKAAELARQGEFDFAAEYDRVVEEEAKRAHMRVRAVDLLNSVSKRITWCVINDETFAKSIPLSVDDRGASMIVKRDWRTGNWRVVGAFKRDRQINYRRLLEGVDFNTAQAFADDEIRRRVPNELLDSQARWRREPYTQGQLDAMRKWKIPPVAINGCRTKGDAADLLDAATLRRVAERA